MAKASDEKKGLIEELKYENQMNNLQPWIKALYKQAEKDPANPGGWSKWSLKPSRKVVADADLPKNYGHYSGGIFFVGNSFAIPLDGGGKQEVLDKFIKQERSEENWEKYVSSICYPVESLNEEEKRFVLLCNTVLGLGLTTEKFLRMSEEDKQELYDRIIGL